MIKLTDDCYGCAECTGCGRKSFPYKSVFCDCCEGEIAERVYLMDGKHFCAECVLEMLDSISVEALTAPYNDEKE